MGNASLALAAILAASSVASCTPDLPPISVCSITGSPPADGCEAASVRLSSTVCRCGARYFWDGSSCAPTTACECYEGCDRLYSSEEDCLAAHAACLREAPYDAETTDAGSGE